MHTDGVHYICHDIRRHVSYGSFLSANTESQRTLSVRYFTTLSQQMLTVIKHVTGDNFVSSRTAHWHIICATQSNCRQRTLNYTSFNYGLQLNSPAVKPTDYKFRDSHISMSIKCKSTRLKKSSSDWLKSCEKCCLMLQY